ncbi:uncharacterized protein LOC144115229 [Amblyomma americanum]
MSGPPSSRSLLRASYPPALLSPNTPPSSPSVCFEYTSLCDLMRSSIACTPPLSRRGSEAGSPQREPLFSRPASSLDNGSTEWDGDLWSRSTQTEAAAENSTPTDELLYERNTGFIFRRLLDVQWNTSFLASVGVLSAVVFTVAVVATLSATSNANKMADSLDLVSDAVQREPASVERGVAIIAPSTARQTATVLRRRDAGYGHISRRADRKKARVPRRRLRTKAKRHRAPPPPRTSSYPKSRRQSPTLSTIRRRTAQTTDSDSSGSFGLQQHQLNRRNLSPVTIGDDKVRTPRTAHNGMASGGRKPEAPPASPVWDAGEDVM